MTGSVSVGCYTLWIFGMTEINEIKSSGKNGLFMMCLKKYCVQKCVSQHRR